MPFPRGRAGRAQLRRRLAVAAGGAEILGRRRQALAYERRELDAEAERTARAWEEAAGEADRWTARALALDGADGLAAAARGASPARVRGVRSENVMGVRVPRGGAATCPDPRAFADGGSSATFLAASAHALAVEAALAHAVALGARDRVGRELARVSRRLRAIERRWIPRHEAALARLELALDEADREEAVRMRWASGREGRR